VIVITAVSTIAPFASVVTAQFTMRIDPELKEAAERAAADDRRSLSSLIEKLLTDYCRDQGLLRPERRPRKSR
jgi:hypothetical protein